MTDIWSSQKRSEVMAKIRKTDSSPERVLRLLLKQAKIRYSTYGSLPGTPDIVIKSSKLAVFVHGCLWHGCPHHYRPPHSNAKYWSAKLRRNRARDRAVARKVRVMWW